MPKIDIAPKPVPKMKTVAVQCTELGLSKSVPPAQSSQTKRAEKSDKSTSGENNASPALVWAADPNACLAPKQKKLLDDLLRGCS